MTPFGLLEEVTTALEGGLTVIGLTGTLETGATTLTALLEPTIGGVTWLGAVTEIGLTIGTLEETGLCTLVGLTALETALGKVLTGAGKGIGWAGLETAGLGLLEGAGVVVPIGGVVRFVCLDGMVGLERVVLGLVVVVVAACGVVWAAGVACGAGGVLEPLFGGVTFGGVAVGGVIHGRSRDGVWCGYGHWV